MDAPALIVIPVFNEEPFLGGVLRGIARHAPGLDVLVVDDGSADGSRGVALSHGALVARHAYNAGYGVAIQTGLKYALRHGYGWAVSLDGDGQHEPASIGPLLGCCTEAGADLAIGSRYLLRADSASASYRGPTLRRMGSLFFGALAGTMMGRTLTDPTSGFLAFSRRAMELYTADAFPDAYPDADALVLAHRQGLRITEHPVIMYPNPAKKSSMHAGLRPVRYVFDMLLSLGLLTLQGDPQRSKAATAGRGRNPMGRMSQEAESPP